MSLQLPKCGIQRKSCSGIGADKLARGRRKPSATSRIVPVEDVNGQHGFCHLAVPLTGDEHAPYLLGNYRLGDARLPVVLASRLWDSAHANRLDTRLRHSNLGLCLVLSTTSRTTRRFLGPGIVIALEHLIDTQHGNVRLDLSRAEPHIDRHQRAAVATQRPRLIRYDAHNALLIGPWPDPWYLTRSAWIEVVAVLVAGWNAGQSRWSRPQLEAKSGIAFRRMDELFRGAPEWTTYLRGADGNRRPRLWQLNIGPCDLLSDMAWLNSKALPDPTPT